EEYMFPLKKNTYKKIHLCKISGLKTLTDFELFGGSKFSEVERKMNLDITVFVNRHDFGGLQYDDIIAAIASGFNLRNYSFRKYRSKVRPISSSVNSVSFVVKDPQIVKKKFDYYKSISKGIFLTRDLVSEPANELYPEKFVDNCKKLAKVGIELEILDEKKIKSLGMKALLGVAQGSVKAPRVLIMNWKGLPKSKKQKPLAFVGKGVTFDTGGISIKPSGGMEDMKWDMGGAGVVAGLMYGLASRKAKVNAVGIVGLVENMPDGNAQRPGDIVKSMSGQTIEVLNTDAEGRLVLADILWYINNKVSPELIVDLATLTGAIIVALGDRYAGLFSNNDQLAQKLTKSSLNVRELIWRLPMDDDFDKLLNCDIADMKNITGTRGAGSITAAQFLKRFVGKTKWAHLDIAGVTWSKKGTAISRPGGTGFGVRLLNNFIEENYE
ncbi:leucyl aminopeptidase, partial [Rickettsiales bacterium]|nr:leucyl aminopeptidase [Rickettsiales bacterium]